MKLSIVSAALVVGTTSAFTAFVPNTYTNSNAHGFVLSKLNSAKNNIDNGDGFDPLNLSSTVSTSVDLEDEQKLNSKNLIMAAAVFLTPSVSNAAGPDWGLFEGKTGSLLHPVMMFSMAAFSVSTALLGFQWRRQRTMGDEISELKKKMPKFEESSLTAAITAAEEAGDAARVSSLKSALPLSGEIATLTAERKELAAKAPKDKHFSQGALLALLGTSFAIEGPLNTYARAGKLFPGPHLYAGAGLVVCWALASSMVPAMQKGNDTARGVHIGANLLGIGLFGWQVVSGFPILLKVWEKTQWP